jgi:uncharacterized protein (TIGR03437 family)
MSCAGDFMTGQAARAVLGQPTFTAQLSGASDTVFGGIGGLAYANNTLFATDANRLGLLPNNNRVLIFNNIGQMLPPADAEIAPYTGRCPMCGGRASVVLGQPDFLSTTNTVSAAGMRLPTGVASDGQMLAVADTANNRVLLWRTIPATTGQPADVVLGQTDFTTVGPLSISASTFRGPQGVWFQNGKLFVADTQNNRVLIWNSIPTQNNQPADVVLGQPNFTTAPQVNQINLNLPATANTMLSPVSVTSDGQRLYVTDLGFNRVLIWNSIPTANQQPADVEIGQLDFTQSVANDNTHLCQVAGTDSNGNPTYPVMCAATMSFPRFALSDGQGRLFVADGGNDRILVFNSIPTLNAARADVILGQPNEFGDLYSTPSSIIPTLTNVVSSASNVTPTPTSLAWDGQNLYVADSTDYRILVFTPTGADVPITGIVNAASRAIFAFGSVVIGGTITDGNTVTVTINGTGYTYKITSKDTVDSVAKAVTDLINAANSGAGDSNASAVHESGLATIRVVARQPGVAGNSITLATSVSASATITATASGANLAGGGDAATVAAGTLITMFGSNLAESSATADLTQQQLPWELANVQVYFDGMRAPLLMVSPTQINTEIPFEIYGSNSISGWVRVRHSDGSVTVTDAVGVPVVSAAPGLFADTGATEPRPALALHGSSYATGTFSVDGGIQAGDIGKVVVGSNTYTYTVQSTDTLASIRDAFINLINANPDELVVASAAVEFTRIRVQAKALGSLGYGIGLSTAVTSGNTGAAQLTLTATNSITCCANTAGAPLTTDNPAVPGETILIYGTGLGLPANNDARTGTQFVGPPSPALVTVSAQSGGSTVSVISSGYKVGMVGTNEIVLELPSTLTANPVTRLTISQSFATSNIVTIPVGPGPLTKFQVNPQVGVLTAGTSVLVGITAQDAAGNTLFNYSGTLHFTSTDPAATLPPDTTLSNGTGTFNVTFNTKGTQTVSATDVATGVTGTSASITVQ